MIIKFFLIFCAFAFDVQSHVTNRYNICDTEECKYMANLIINSMNKSADPCEDFYNYACGLWATNYPVPENKLTWDINEQIRNNIAASLRRILQEEEKPEDSVPLSIEKKLFKSCMNEDRIEEESLEGLSKIIKNNGGWPMFDKEWNEKDFPWQKVAKGYMHYNADILFSIGIIPDPRNSSVKRIYLQKPGNTLQDKQFTNNLFKLLNTNNVSKNKQKENKLLEVIIQVVEFYANYTKTEVNLILLKRTLSMYRFMSRLYQIKPSDDQEVGNAIEITTIRQLQKYNRNKCHNNRSKLDWIEIFRTFLKNTNVNIDHSEQIVIADKSYFDDLFALLEGTPQETIVNCLHWNFLLSNLDYLNKDARKLSMQLKKSFTRIIPIKENRLEECLESQLLKDGVANEYLGQNFPESLAISAKELAEDIRAEIGNAILNTHWMDSKAKLLAIEKLRAMKVQIGYPEYYKSETEFNKIYEGLNIGENYFDNMMRLNRFNTIKELIKFKKPFDGNEWYLTPLTVNAYHINSYNSLVVPAAQLLIPTFGTNGPMSVNYGAIGFILGHEMSHGFDMTGYNLDQNGNQISWSDKAVNDFETRADCFIKQYNNYGVNGKLTQSENIADSAGLNAAFSAFIKKSEKTKELKLPNLEDVTQNQLFFLSFANTFCRSTSVYYETFVTNDEDDHTRVPLRINAAVANVKKFAAAFQCSKNSPLNPKERCIIWE